MGAPERSAPEPAAVAALGGATGLFAGQATAWWSEDPNDWRFQLLLPLICAGLIALVVMVAVLGGRKLLSPHAARVSLIVGAAAAGLFTATPVGLRWNDGCNSHDAHVPLLTAPAAALIKPAEVRLSYDEIVTLAACLPTGVSPVQPG